MTISTPDRDWGRVVLRYFAGIVSDKSHYTLGRRDLRLRRMLLLVIDVVYCDDAMIEGAGVFVVADLVDQSLGARACFLRCERDCRGSKDRLVGSRPKDFGVGEAMFQAVFNLRRG